MKKIFTFVIAIVLSLNMLAQCPLSTAVDFTATDVHGTEVHLFDILDGGQYVLVDFFFTTCGPCQQATPKIVESYYAMGCNMHDVFYVEIATGDNENACLNWVNTYGVEYPTISGVAGGTSICSQFQISQYPTVILIAPDRSIVINDLWPISNAQTVISALENQGLQQHDCEPAPTGEVVFSTDTISFEIGNCIDEPGVFTIYNETTADLLIEDYQSDEFALLCLDGEFEGNDIKGMTIAPSDSLVVYVYYEESVKDYEMNGTLHLMTSFGNYDLAVVIYVYDGVDEINADHFTIYPNPANDFLRINGENLDNVMIFNVMGQKIEEFEINTGKELNINTSNYENGVYFVKVGKKTQKFVVTH
ncbi:MAG: T9SS type A sorting domain-containing protein [Bacteroidales bacterium]|nr:T9SS type A sorting domain-containing protein [Bacteroidales bacterium]